MIIAGVVLLLLVIAGGAFAFMNLTKTAKNTLTANPQEAAPTKSSSVFNSIQDIFTNKSLSLSCNFTDAEGRNTVSYIKNGEIRADVTGKTASQNGSIIVKSNTMYFWNGPQGMMLKFDPSQMMGGANGSAQSAQGQAALASLDKYKESCKPAVVDDNLFTPPANVKFQDVSQIMKTLPSGAAGANSTAVPSINPSDYQKMMQQYQNP